MNAADVSPVVWDAVRRDTLDDLERELDQAALSAARAMRFLLLFHPDRLPVARDAHGAIQDTIATIREARESAGEWRS